MFIACELGQRINLAFIECNEMFDQLEWYLFPAEIMRLLPLIFNFMQQPVDIACFGSTALDRDTFKYVRAIEKWRQLQKTDQIGYLQVTNTAFSYFTMLRQFYD